MTSFHELKFEDFVFQRSDDHQVADSYYEHKTRSDIHIQVSGFYPQIRFSGVIVNGEVFIFLDLKTTPLEAIASIHEYLKAACSWCGFAKCDCCSDCGEAWVLSDVDPLCSNCKGANL